MPQLAYFPTPSMRELVDGIDREIIGRMRRAVARDPDRFFAVDYPQFSRSITLCGPVEDAERIAYIKERLAQFVRIGLLRRAKRGEVAGFIVSKTGSQEACADQFTSRDIKFLRSMGVGA